MALDATTDLAYQYIRQQYELVHKANSPVTLTQMAGVTAQIAAGMDLSNEQKMVAVKYALPRLIAELPLTEEQRTYLTSGLSLIEELVETALVVLKQNSKLKSTLCGCFSSASVELPFPVLSK